MAKSPPNRDARDANLEALKSAVGTYVEEELSRLDNEVLFLDTVLKGRGGTTKAAEKNLAAAKTVAVASIDSFLTGE